MDKTKELIKDRECIHCEKFFSCIGKIRGTNCINFSPRREGKEDGRK